MQPRRHEDTKKKMASTLFVTERFDGVQTRGLEGGVHAEKDADRGGEADADGKGPPGQRDGEPGDPVDRQPDEAPEGDAEDAAGEGEDGRFHQELKQDLQAARHPRALGEIVQALRRIVAVADLHEVKAPDLDRVDVAALRSGAVVVARCAGHQAWR